MCELEPQFAETLRQNQGWPHSDGHRYFADATILQNDIRELDAERLMHGETIDCVIIANCCLAGPEKFSPASLSRRESRRCRAFIREVAVKQIVTDTTEPKLPIKESWLEYEYERYETLPVNKRTSGVRLCVSLEDNDDKLSRHYGVIKAVSPAKSVKDRRAVWSRGGCRIDFLVEGTDDFPKTGRFTIRNQRTTVTTFEFTNSNP